MSGLMRSRWSAIGAALAVTLGAGGFGFAGASAEVESSFVSVTPARILDTRTGSGLVGPLVSPSPRVLQVTGSIARQNGSLAVVVPSGASAVVLNVTVVGADASGFLSVRPDGTPGVPETSNLNFIAAATISNAVTVALPSSGKIELTYDAYGAVGPTTNVLVDVTGYYTPTSGVGGTGPAGPAGPAGPQGVAGPSGLTLIGQFTPTQIIHGALVTCASTFTNGTDTNCNGLAVNGLSVRSGSTAPNVICDIVTGHGPAGLSGGAPVSSTFFDWVGSAWVLSTDSASPISGLGCFRL